MSVLMSQVKLKLFLLRIFQSHRIDSGVSIHFRRYSFRT